MVQQKVYGESLKQKCIRYMISIIKESLVEAISKYIDFYNHQRYQTRFDSKAPMEVRIEAINNEKTKNIIQSHLIQESQNIRSHSKTKPNQHDANWVINFTYLVCPLDRDQIRLRCFFFDYDLTTSICTYSHLFTPILQMKSYIQKKTFQPLFISWNAIFQMVVPVGIEPTIQGFSVLCSTDWATGPFGCGGRIWTNDLRVMSPTSYQAALPRDI